MNEKRKPDDVLVVEEYTTDNGEIKTRFHRVGVAWHNKEGGRTVVLPEGISLSGRFIIAPRRDSAPDDGPSHEEAVS